MTMPAIRNLWFETPHLLDNVRGRALLLELDILPDRARQNIMAAGDDLAEFSLTLAQTFCYNAPTAWKTFGGTQFAKWFDIGKGLVDRDPSSREGAVAYFSISPVDLEQVGLAKAESWASIGREVLKTSRRLGSQFLETSAPLLNELQSPLEEQLRAWARNGTDLLKKKGWKGEFLAISYFRAAPAALPVLASHEMREWTALGVLVQDSGPWNFFPSFPAQFGSVASSTRLQLLKDCQRAATRSTGAAEKIFLELPSRLVALASTALQEFVYQLLSPVIRSDPESLPPLFNLLNLTIRTLHIDKNPLLRDALLSLAARFYKGIPVALRTLPRAREEAGELLLSEWIKKGADIGVDNPSAGVAFFAMESRTSLKVLRRDPTAIDLEEIQEVLRRYIQMLSGAGTGITPQECFSFPPGLENFPFVSDAVPLPARIDLFSTYEKNFRLFRAFATLQAGRREFGTYNFQLAILWPTLSKQVQELADEAITPKGHLYTFFHCFPHPDIVESLFLLADTDRISKEIGECYRGLEADLQWLGTLSLPSVVPKTIQSVFASYASGNIKNNTVYDSARWAAETYHRIMMHTRLSKTLEDEDTTYEAALYETVGGQTFIEAEAGDEQEPEQRTDYPQLDGLNLEPEEDLDGAGSPLSPDELKALIEAGADLKIRQGKSDNLNPQGLFITDLDGKIASAAELEESQIEGNKTSINAPARKIPNSLTFYYDEWDYKISDYRVRWCQLKETILYGDAGEFFAKTLADYATLAPAIKSEFQRIRPEQYKIIRGLEDGEEFDLDSVITAFSDRRAKVAPSSKLYTKRRQTERDVAALFLLDMSASTDEPVDPIVDQSNTSDDWEEDVPRRRTEVPPKPRRIIDVTKEALVLMAEALEEIGDAYAVYGFSGQGRDNVEFYHVKSFSESLSPTIKGRIGAIEPKRSTRMGPAIRHSIKKLKDVASRVKLLVLLSDGFPQDMDYGADRRSNTYGIQDTMMALREADRAGVLTFCLTVDKAGHDYLREMCEKSRYMVLEDVDSLPSELPKVYQRYIRPNEP